ncbi:MAG: hypothetical protein UT84_C0057G0008 [Candidatus Curtissbacteria bacterium GW2011_GWA1_40_16]|uniref:Uncharacterized protein n=1 Tax=Candidatus Curtissbacteria bacterium GW2011_GWA1_40_16 TaxID=1618405 RepID=A0A0G0RD02_9BACT|nr:MAG: hypothetical protein UT84_C0057G0008 [Candidatus Curtissbacteria bacterium GW2011_GWA1_40_16]
MKKNKLPIPEFKSIEEMANFWDTHDTEDYQWEPAPEVIRLDESTKKAIEKVAREKGIGISTTARMLIRERLLQIKAI